MVDKTIMNREQFIRKMIEGKTITEALPAPLLQTVRMMKDAQFNIRKISEYALLSRPVDEKLLRKTLEDINTCVQEVMARCLPLEERRSDTHEIRPHRPGSDRVR